MTVLDTFYLLFKSDASGAKNDIQALDKQISALAAKGKKISDDEIKQLKELSKERKELVTQLKEQEKQTDAIGKSFVNVAEAATSAATAILSLNAIKAGVMNAAQLNSSLEIQSRLLGQNAGQMKAYAAATESAGGSQQGFLGYMQGVFSEASARKIALPQVGQLMQRLHDNVKGLPPELASQRFQALGITDPGMQSLLLQSDPAFAKSIAGAKGRTKNDPDTFPNAREAEKALTDAGQSLNNVFTTLGNTTLPTVVKALEGFTDFLNHISESPGETVGVVAAAAAGASWLSSKIVGGLASSFKAGGALNVGRTLAKGAGIVGAAAAIAEGTWWVLGQEEQGAKAFAKTDSGKRLGNWIFGTPQLTRAKAGANEKESYQYWISQGYSPGQAAGLVANERAESGGDPDARGDDNTAFGSFQWHQRRRRNILAGTGIDVAHASHADQLKAAAWEIKNMGLNIPDDPAAAGAYISRRFEMPANETLEAMKRANIASDIARSNMALASGSPLNNVSSIAAGGGTGNSSSVTLNGGINVHTQATDAEGIAGAVGGALKKQLSNAVSSYDDGVKY